MVRVVTGLFVTFLSLSTHCIITRLFDWLCLFNDDIIFLLLPLFTNQK